MFKYECDVCGKKIKNGGSAIAITGGFIDKDAEGFEPDGDAYIGVYCSLRCLSKDAKEFEERND